MSIRFACPSCGASGSVDDRLAGRSVRCRHCQHRFAIPSPGEPAADVYTLAEPIGEAAGLGAPSSDSGSIFVARRGDERASAVARTTRPAASGSPTRPARRRESDVNINWRAWLIRIAIVALVASLATALFAPDGPWIVGCSLMGLGSLMVLVGYLTGAYGAFREDLLYGILYVFVPLYTAYYVITRWDDLWIWFACSTTGVALVAFGTQILRWTGVSL